MLTEQLDYLYGLARYGIKPGLATMQALMEELGHPEQKFPSVHITGTNGKGSTAALLESALRAGGVRTALYTSPHLYTFNERIRINGKAITDSELSSYIGEVRRAADRAGVQPTFFEFTTAIAFIHFARQPIELAVVEVGMGGRRDATNIIKPLVSVITNIDLDHVAIIGPTKQHIAEEKAGIIKPNTPAVVGDRDPGIISYLRHVAAEQNAPIHHAPTTIQTEPQSSTWHQQTFTADGMTYTMPLIGRHQCDNAATALLTMKVLADQGIAVSPTAIQEGFANAHWEGRLEVISDQPFILIDGAHNPQSLEVLASFLTNPATKPPRYDVLITALKQDKDTTILAEKIAPLFAQVIATEGVYEPMPADELANRLRPYNQNIATIANPTEAVRQGRKIIGREGSLVITGSLYMIPVALAELKEKGPIGPLTP